MLALKTSIGKGTGLEISAEVLLHGEMDERYLVLHGRTRAASFYTFIPATALSHFDPARFPLSEPLRRFGPNFGFQPGGHGVSE